MSVLTTQDNVYLSLSTPLGKDKLIISKLEGLEAFCQLFQFQVECYAVGSVSSSENNLNFSDLIQQPVTIKIQHEQGTRYLNGIVTKITQGPTVSFNTTVENKAYEKTYYFLTVCPMLWLATLTENCAIFQNQVTLDIIKAVLANYQIELKDQTSGTTSTREYCVQYNESDFNFVSRLMEAEGVYYYFQHTDTSHTMVLCDGSQPFDANAQTASLPIIFSSEKISPDILSASNVRVSQQIVSSSYISKDYDFTKPSTNLKANSTGQGSGKNVYHYPGNYLVQTDGQTIADRRLGALEFPMSSLQLDTNNPLLELGLTIQFSNCPRQDMEEQDFVSLSIYHQASQADAAAVKDQRCLYSNRANFFNKTQPYIPLNKTPTPKIYGTQTAVVTGKAGEEIWTDAYGRILVKFFWDLSDTENDKTSCWIRVAQGWSGANWGQVFIPRVGQEVVVSFLNGNPDYPLITGSVYNGENLPPYLPDTPTKSTIKTNSSKGGDGFNELRFEDKAGSEEIYMHAQKDLNIDVLNGDRTTTLEGENGGGNDTLLLKKGNRTMTLDQGDETVTLSQGNRSVNITGNDGVQVSGNRTTQTGGNEDVEVTGNYTLKVGGNLTIQVTGEISIEGSSSFSLQATAAAQVQALSYQLTAQTSAQFQAQAQISLQSQGQIMMESQLIQQTGQSMIMLQGAAVQVSANGVVTIVGNMVLIG